MFFGLGSCSSGCDGLLRDQASSFVGTPAWLPAPSGDKLRSPKAAGHAEHKWTSSGETGLFTRPADSTTGDSSRDRDWSRTPPGIGIGGASITPGKSETRPGGQPKATGKIGREQDRVGRNSSGARR